MKASDNQFPSVTLEEVASDGSDLTNPAADHRRLFLGEDGALHLRDSSGTITAVGGGIADQGAFTYLDATEAAAPSTPASGKVRIYAKTDGRIYSLDDGGNEYGPFDAAGSGSSEPAWDVLGTHQAWWPCLGENGNAGYPAANMAIYIPFVVPAACTVYRMFYRKGGTTTVTSNVDMGIYQPDGTRVVSSGSTAYSTSDNGAVRTVNLADTALDAGLYYFALANSVADGGNQFARLNVGSDAPLGVMRETSAFPLPATATWSAPAANVTFFPIIGIICRSELTF